MPDSTKSPHSKPSKRSFSEVFFPARTNRLLEKARGLAYTRIESAQLLAHKWGPPSVLNMSYIRWLERASMLYNARQLAYRYSGKGVMWQSPYAKAQPRKAIQVASVWYTTYPISTITRQNQSILNVLADESLWKTLQQIGIKALHTGPMKQAGGLRGWTHTPSIDGHYDRISNQIEPMFGTQQEYQEMCRVAAEHDGIILDDLVPGHTGKGADFQLATMNYKNYPGIYHMVEIDREDWDILPDVPKGKDSVNLDADTESALKKAGYIIGKFQRVIFYEPGVKETNWSVTRAVQGTDGKKHRWVYLHYFKDGQPAINWLDPSFAGMQLVVGDALHSITELGVGGLRLDANGFLGAEISAADTPAWSEGHPLSAAANQLIAGMVRKVGRFTFQELNLSLDDIKATSDFGADLSYDFINRPAYHHALATGDTEFLRLMLRTTLEMGIDPASLVHALQNHDELTTELVHFWTAHQDDEYTYKGESLKGGQLRQKIRQELHDAVVNNHSPYNKSFTENGIACTTTSLIAAILGYESFESIGAEGAETIKRIHLLLAMFNAFQPGVFALSGWDMCGAFMLDPEEVRELVHNGDTRWLNRGAFDLMNVNPEAKSTSAGIPKANSLYGSLPEQLKDPNSFASQLKQLLAIRSKYGIATSYQVAIPDVEHPGILAMIHHLEELDQLQITVLNFSNLSIEEELHSPHLPAGSTVTDMLSGTKLGRITAQHRIIVKLEPYQGTSLLVDD